MKIIEWYMNHINEKVEKYWKIYNFDMGEKHTSYNNEGDAFKHTYCHAELTLFFGPLISKWIGIKHEDNNPSNNDAERTMDLHNNEVGRRIAKEIKMQYPLWIFEKWDDIIASKVIKALANGELITNT